MANEQQLQALLRQAAAKLGMSEEQLVQSAKNGSLAQQLQTQQNDALRRVLNDPDEAQKLLNSPQAQKLLQMLQNNGTKK